MLGGDRTTERAADSEQGQIHSSDFFRKSDLKRGPLAGLDTR
jgi:hypothetical protein